MKKYEAIVILDDQRVEDAGKAFAQDLQGAIESLGGTVESATSIGQRQLAYQIKKRNTGIYWCIVCEMPEEQVIALKEKYRLTESVLRLEVFVYDRPEVVCGKKEDDE